MARASNPGYNDEGGEACVCDLAKVVPLLGWKRGLDVAEKPATRLLTRSACPAP
ncbi:hypothetical protein ABT187_45450 [Streptomyces sp. NPDC001817]|uniref:hypothetical protein n=1 Tax=Streptomyces sp. NPDC001817 TaxID=3154398 RepID=UPI00332BB0D9